MTNAAWYTAHKDVAVMIALTNIGIVYAISRGSRLTNKGGDKWRKGKKLSTSIQCGYFGCAVTVLVFYLAAHLGALLGGSGAEEAGWRGYWALSLGPGLVVAARGIVSESQCFEEHFRWYRQRQANAALVGGLGLVLPGVTWLVGLQPPAWLTVAPLVIAEGLIV